KDTAWSKCNRLTAVCVVLLCVLLLTAVTVLSIKYNNLTVERDQLQRERDGYLKIFYDLDTVKYFNSSIYFMRNETKTWTESRQNCMDKGADLVIINSGEEQEFIITLMENIKEAWIGLSDRDTEGKWKWVDGTEQTSNTGFWYEGEPNDESNNEDCGEIFTFSDKKAWNDRPCSDKSQWIYCGTKPEYPEETHQAQGEHANSMHTEMGIGPGRESNTDPGGA
ncbi:C-type lectin domain family 4 member E-like isoform X1, partial [Clarias magur]